MVRTAGLENVIRNVLLSLTCAFMRTLCASPNFSYTPRSTNPHLNCANLCKFLEGGAVGYLKISRPPIHDGFCYQIFLGKRLTRTVLPAQKVWLCCGHHVKHRVLTIKKESIMDAKTKEAFKTVLKVAMENVWMEINEYHLCFPDRPKITGDKCEPRFLLSAEAGGFGEIVRRNYAACCILEDYLVNEYGETIFSSESKPTEEWSQGYLGDWLD